MKKKMRKAVAKHLRVLADLNMLTDVVVKIDRDPPDPSSDEHVHASTTADEHVFHMRIFISPTVFEKSALEQNEIFIHELWHQHTSRLAKLAKRLDKDEMLTVQIENDEDRIVEAVARSMAPYMPDPPWTKKKTTS